MVKNDFQYGGCNSYTLQCDMWLWNHDSKFTKWQHHAMWHVALGSWHWIRQVAAPCNVAGGSGMTCHWIRLNVCHIGILHLVSISIISPQSTCHSAPVCKILSKSDHPCTTSYRLSIDTIALNCLVFHKIAFLPQPMSSCSVCLWVCLSVTFTHSVKMNKDIFEIFSPLGSHTILVFNSLTLR